MSQSPGRERLHDRPPKTVRINGLFRYDLDSDAMSARSDLAATPADSKVVQAAFDMIIATGASAPGVWERHIMALDDVTRRLERISAALQSTGVPFAFVGGQAVAMWVATKDPAAVRTTKDVDILVHRNDLPRAKKAALSCGMEYFEVLGVGMFLEHSDPNPRRAVHVVWAEEKVRPEYPLASPSLADSELLEPGRPVVSLHGLVRMKLMSNREQDRVHLRDIIGVDLVSRDFLIGLPSELATRLEQLLTEEGR